MLAEVVQVFEVVEAVGNPSTRNHAEGKDANEEAATYRTSLVLSLGQGLLVTLETSHLHRQLRINNQSAAIRRRKCFFVRITSSSRVGLSKIGRLVVQRLTIHTVDITARSCTLGVFTIDFCINALRIDGSHLFLVSIHLQDIIIIKMGQKIESIQRIIDLAGAGCFIFLGVWDLLHFDIFNLILFVSTIYYL